MAKLRINKKTGLLSATCLFVSMMPALGQGLLLTDPADDASARVQALPAAISSAATGGQGLVPFQDETSAMMLSGEDDDTVLTFSVTEGQLAAGGSIRIGYQNAVSVLPDSSVIEVALNGQPLGSFPVRSPNGVDVQSFAVPAANLKPGRNTIALHARHMHRVDCSLEATYELWTRIDPKTSGFASAAPLAFASVEDLAGVGKTADGRTDVRLVMPKNAKAEVLSQALPLVQILALYLNRTDVMVSVADTAGTGPGIDLYIGADETGLSHEPGMEPLARAAYGLTVSEAGADRARVTLKSTTTGDLRAALLSQVRGAMSDGFKSGIFAATPGVVNAEAGKTFTLADAGYRTRAFSGHLSRTHFKLVMPADFYPGDYATLDMNLHAATSPGLDPNSQLLIRVNDRVVTSYPFRDVDGQQFDGKRIAMPLRAFHPGVNTVDILAEVPKPSDAVCATNTAETQKPRFLLLENTSLTVPALARVARLPDLAALAGKGFPFQSGKPFNLFVEQPDAASLGAALTLVSRLSLSAGNPLNATIRFSAPDTRIAGNALIVSAAAKTASQPVLPSATLNGLLGAPESDAVDPTETSALAAPLAGPVALPDADPQALLDAFRQSTASDQPASSATMTVRNFMTRASQRFANWLRYEDLAQTNGNGHTKDALISLQQVEAPSGEGTWTYLRADTEDHLFEGTRTLVSSPVWSRLNGGSAIIRASDQSLETAAAHNRTIAEFTDVSPGNLRRLAAAWFSENFIVYVGLVLGVMGLVALALGRIVPRAGVRTDA